MKFKIDDLVLIVGADPEPVQGVVEDIHSQNIVKVRTATGVRLIFTSALRHIGDD